MIIELKEELEKMKNREYAKNLQKFFKTGKGEYGEGDIFLGIRVPVQRSIAKKYKNLKLIQIQELLSSKIHEHRLIGLLILIEKYQEGDKIEKGKIFKFYLDNTNNINNWDLVDLSASRIIGDYLIQNPELMPILEKFAKSDNLWKKRIAIISTSAFIREETDKIFWILKISEILLEDNHDLIHKAVGWMLREFGKKDLWGLECFLRKHYKKIPRTTLRYAIEKFPEEKRKSYLNERFT